MGFDEFMLTTPGEMMDLIGVYQVSQGIAEEKEKQAYVPDLR